MLYNDKQKVRYAGWRMAIKASADNVYAVHFKSNVMKKQLVNFRIIPAVLTVVLTLFLVSCEKADDVEPVTGDDPPIVLACNYFTEHPNAV